MKIYFGITRRRGQGNTIVGVVANNAVPGGRAATEDEVRQIIEKIKGQGTDSLLDALREGNYNTPIVFERRAEAREGIGSLNALNDPNFTFSVVELGEPAQRDTRKVLGWKLYCRMEGQRKEDNFVSAHNCPDESKPENHERNFVKLDGQGYAFRNRKSGRAYIKANGLDNLEDTDGMLYQLLPVYEGEATLCGEPSEEQKEKRIGFRIMLRLFGRDDAPSSINNDRHGGNIVVDHAHQFDGDLDANRLFSSRERAYAAMVEVVGRSAEGYYIAEVPY